MTVQGLPATATMHYTHDAWNRLTAVHVDTTPLGEYEYNALHWRTAKRARVGVGPDLDEMRLMYYSANWQLLEERIDRQWAGSGFAEDEKAQTFWGKRYIDDAVLRRRDRPVSAGYEDHFFYVSDAQFSTVAMVQASNARVVERTTYDAYGNARHHFGGDVDNDGAALLADDSAIVATINAGSNSIGQANYKAEQDLNRDGAIDLNDRLTLQALTGNASQPALPSGFVSFVTTGTGSATRHGPDNPIAWDSYVFNSESGQYHVRRRHYDPPLGRWIETDPLVFIDGMNRFTYVSNGPTGRLDPFGLSGDWWKFWKWFSSDDNETQSASPCAPETIATGRRRRDHFDEFYESFGLSDHLIPEDGQRCKRQDDCLDTISESAHIVGDGLEVVVTTAGIIWIVAPTPGDPLEAAIGAKLVSKMLEKGYRLVKKGKGKWFWRSADGCDEVIKDSKTLKRLADVERHHLLPKEFADQFRKAGLHNLDDFMAPLSRNAHRLSPDGLHCGPEHWNALWRQFFQTHENPTKEQIIEHLRELMKRYDLVFDLP